MPLIWHQKSDIYMPKKSSAFYEIDPWPKPLPTNDNPLLLLVFFLKGPRNFLKNILLLGLIHWVWKCLSLKHIIKNIPQFVFIGLIIADIHTIVKFYSHGDFILSSLLNYIAWKDFNRLEIFKEKHPCITFQMPCTNWIPFSCIQPR